MRGLAGHVLDRQPAGKQQRELKDAKDDQQQDREGQRELHRGLQFLAALVECPAFRLKAGLGRRGIFLHNYTCFWLVVGPVYSLMRETINLAICRKMLVRSLLLWAARYSPWPTEAP